jgi:hypothetical protein
MLMDSERKRRMIALLYLGTTAGLAAGNIIRYKEYPRLSMMLVVMTHKTELRLLMLSINLLP